MYGIDQSPAFIDAAQRFAAEEGLEERIEFQTGDVHKLAFENESLDVVFAHTLMSHVTDPLQVLKEVARG